MKKTSRLAFCAMSCAISLSILFFASFFSILSIATAQICGLVVFLIILMYGVKYGAYVYLIVVISSMFIIPNKEAVFLYICFFGIYPTIYYKLNNIKNKIFKMFVKLSIFSIFAFIINYIFFYFLSFYENIKNYIFFIYSFCFFIIFFIYDICIARFTIYYNITLKNILKKFFHK